MGLFILRDNFQIDLEPEIIQIKAFKDIISKSKNKENIRAELAYIYFLCDYRSPYMNIENYKERSEKIIKDVYPGWKPDKLTEKGIEVYKELRETFQIKFLKDALLG